jgi:hypothetical protein
MAQVRFLIFRTDGTYALTVAGNRMLLKQAQDDFSLEPNAVTGIRRFYSFGWDREGRILIDVEDPVAATLLSVTREVAY